MSKTIAGFPAAVKLPKDVAAILSAAPSVQIPLSREELFDLATGGPGQDTFEVAYEVPGKGWVVEATAVRCRNGVAVNYEEQIGRAHV